MIAEITEAGGGDGREQPVAKGRTGTAILYPLSSILAEAALAGYGQARWRGGVLGTIKMAPMGKGHGNRGQPFDINTACYLKPIFAEYDAARRNGSRLKLVLMAGVKTIKSFFGESCAADHVCHASGDAAIFFATGETADVGATTRILDFFKGIKHFIELLLTMKSRFDDTKGALKFPGKTLFILSANMSNTQQKNLAFVLLQDAFLTEATGIITEIMARTTQYENEAIVILESQGGETGFDFDRHYSGDEHFKGTDQRELHVRCPRCGAAHIFNWKAWDMTRPDEFEAVLPIARKKEIEQRVLREFREGARIKAGGMENPISDSELAKISEISVKISEALESARRELSVALKSEERRRCGFKRGEDELIKFADGSYNEAAILRETHFECYHCGGIWRDDGEFGPTRIALDESSHYVAVNPNALPGDVGFNVPQWINRRLSWGKMMLNKLKAQRTADQLGNFEDLKKWWQKVGARTWDKSVGIKTSARIQGSQYDDKVPLPGEKLRISATDCQFNLTWMCYQAWAIGDGTPPRLLHREIVVPPGACITDEDKREWCKERVRALDKEYAVEQQNSMKDCAHRPDLVREWAAQDAAIVVTTRGWVREKKLYTYGLLIGDEKLSFRWKNPGRKPTWERFAQEYNWTIHDILRDGKRMPVRVHARLWSNFSIKEIAVRWRDGDSAPRIIVHEKFLTDRSKEGFSESMKSERKLPWKKRPGKERYDNENRPNHDWDCFCMMMVRMDELGYLNNFAAPEADQEA